MTHVGGPHTLGDKPGRGHFETCVIFFVSLFKTNKFEKEKKMANINGNGKKKVGGMTFGRWVGIVVFLVLVGLLIAFGVLYYQCGKDNGYGAFGKNMKCIGGQFGLTQESRCAGFGCGWDYMYEQVPFSPHFENKQKR